MTNSAPIFQFTVAVDIHVTPAKFTIYNPDGSIADKPVVVTVDNTKIEYQLIDNTDELVFVQPDIAHDDHGDLTVAISDNGQLLTLTDSDADNETICVKLVVAQSSNLQKTYTSQDPQIKNE